MNYKIINSIVILTWFLLWAGTSFAFASNSSQADTIRVDKGQELLWKRNISPGIIDEYRQLPEYNYGMEPKEHETLWQRIKRWLGKWISRLENALGVLWYLRYIIIAAFSVTLIVIIMKGNITGLFRPQKPVAPLNYTAMEDPTKTDWERLIQNALRNKDYRLATRYHFLQLLKQLNEAGLIRWKLEKTNRDYQNEIKAQELNTSFKRLTRLYEAVWYGNFPIHENDYAQISGDFSNMKDKMQNTPASKSA